MSDFFVQCMRPRSSGRQKLEDTGIIVIHFLGRFTLVINLTIHHQQGLGSVWKIIDRQFEYILLKNVYTFRHKIDLSSQFKNKF